MPEKEVYPELTKRGTIMGFAIGSVVCMAVVCMGLRAGTTIVGSIPATIIGMGIYMAIFKRSRIQEVNIVQTAGSAVSGVAAGIAFTVPALYILGEPIHLAELIAASTLGGVCGVAFIIPLRRQLIEIDHLAFPTGMACATVLKSPGVATKKLMLMLLTIAVGACITIPTLPIFGTSAAGEPSFLIPSEIDFSEAIGLPEYVLFALSISTMLIGVGLIIGPFYATFQFIFAMLGYWLVIPFAVRQGITPPDLALARNYIASPLGVGAMLGATVVSMILMAPGLRQSMKELMRKTPRIEGNSREDISGKWIILSAIAILIGFTILSLLYSSLPMAILAAVIAVVWIFAGGAIVAIATGLTDTSPISGIALISAILMVAVFGINNIFAIVMIACGVCVAVSQAADIMEDLRAGYLVGTEPRKQEILKFIGPVFGSIIGVLTLGLIAQTYGIATGVKGEMFPAPQGAVLASILGMIQGGEVPYLSFLGGAFIGGAISLAGFPGVLAGLGIYLPLSIPFTIAVGGWIKGGLNRIYGKEKIEEYTVPIAAGLIIGEAMTLIVFGIWVVATAVPGAG
jgi:putative OPT family oligopeptide transporter